MALLNVLVDEVEGNVPVTILRVEGDVFASTQDILRDTATGLIEAGARNILIDLSGVDYMASAGFMTIHAITNMLNQDESEGDSKSRHLKLLSPTATVTMAIETLGFDKYLDIFHDQDEAIRSF